MDPALTLRTLCDADDAPPKRQALEMLAASPLVARLTADFVPKPTFAVWRALALAEIPFAAYLPYTGRLVQYIEEHMATEAGFSLYGGADALLPCYNATLLEAWAKLGHAHTEVAKAAAAWLVQYQPFARGTGSGWHTPTVQKYGGCFHNTPCYIGVAKATKALVHYNIATGHAGAEAVACAAQGVEYLLAHRLLYRLRDGAPIYKHILALTFPPSYQLNVVELLETVYTAGKIAHPACRGAVRYVLQKRTTQGQWKASAAYKADGYVRFDPPGQRAEWLTYLLGRYTAHAGGNTPATAQP